MEYNCDCCHYNTNIKSNYLKHLDTQKHYVAFKKKEKEENKQIKTVIKEKFLCKYCCQKFSFRQSMNRHIKYSCTKNKDEDLKELVRLLNNQLEQQKTDFQTQLQSQHNQLQTQSKQIEKLMGKLEININTTNIQNNIKNNITLLSYNDTDVSHLTDNDYKKCIKKVCFCVMGLIEKIHFNPEKPENMNIYISNMKDKYLMIYENGNWNLKNKKYEMDKLYDDKETMIEQWVEENKDPEMEKFFKKYLNNKKDTSTIDMINEEIKMMMYNKKKTLEI